MALKKRRSVCLNPTWLTKSIRRNPTYLTSWAYYEMSSQRNLQLSQEARRNNDLPRPNHKPLPPLHPFLRCHRSCLLDHQAPYSRLLQRTAALDHHLHPRNPTSRLREQKVLLYLLYRQVWNVLRAAMDLPPCNNRHQSSRCRIIACRDTTVRLPFHLSLNSHFSRDRLKASLTLLLLNLLSKDIRYRLSIKLARPQCRCLPPIRVECQACPRRANNNTLVLRRYSKHGNKDRLQIYLCRHRSPHHRLT